MVLMVNDFQVHNPVQMERLGKGARYRPELLIQSGRNVNRGDHPFAIEGGVHFQGRGLKGYALPTQADHLKGVGKAFQVFLYDPLRQVWFVLLKKNVEGLQVVYFHDAPTSARCGRLNNHGQEAIRPRPRRRKPKTIKEMIALFF